MDLQTFINLGVAIVVPSVGGLLAWVWNVHTALHNFQLEVAKEYVTHEDLIEIKKLLEKISDKLERKADRDPLR